MKIISLDKGCIAFILGLLLWCSHMHANYINPVPGTAFWQSTVSGIVSDASGPLPGVIVAVRGTERSVVSDGDGKYSIAATVGDTLIFSFIGYKEIEQPVTAAVHNAELSEDSLQLEQLTINAGYYSVKDKEKTGSIARITAKDIESQPVVSALATMQGRMAGVSVTQTTGVPGGGFSIQIRGQNSLRAAGNAPLYIIDGVPYSSESIGSGTTSGIFGAMTSPLNSINPDNIASIEVLKDADATAIYGSRGANGVVLITTKKGKEGKTSFSVNYSHGISEVASFIDLMDTRQYIEMRKEAYQNDGITEYPPFAYDVNGTWDQDRYTDWQETLIGGTAQYTGLNATVSGGDSRNQFLLSGNILRQTTVFPGDFTYRKGNMHAQASHESTDKRFRADFSAIYTAQDNNQPYMDLTRQALSLAPNAPALYDAEGNLNWENGTFGNPLSILEGKHRSNTYDLLSNATLSYRLAEGLIAKTALGYSDLRHEESSTAPSSMFNPAFGIGSEYSILFINNATRRSWIVEPQLTWKQDIGELGLQLLAGTTFQEVKSAALQQTAMGFPSDALIYNLGAASSVTVNSNNKAEYRYQAFFGRANLNWKGRYILNITGRRDGSSRFGPGRQFANFGAVGAAWIFSDEGFSQGLPWLSFGKLRISYGTSGNDQIGDYQFMDTYASNGVPYQGVIGLEPTRLYNPDFGWEENKKFEAAVEMGFFKDRLLVTGALFRNNSSSQLVGIPLPGTTGFSSVQANLDAVVRNQGIEFTIKSVNFESKNFSWITSFNFTRLSNKLVSYPDLANSSYAQQLVIGRPLNIQKVFEYTGINPVTGLYEFRDFNGDGRITAPEDRQATADLNPSYYGGLENTFKLGGLELGFLFQFVKQQNWNYLSSFGLPGIMENQPSELAGRWQQEGTAATYQQYSSGANAAATEAFSHFRQSNAAISDASFIRLKNISISYSLPEEWLPKLTCRIFIQGQNLLTITDYKGADPEYRNNGLPPLRTITTGLQVNF